jgi:multicomponent Na+:H+ antiporter subunit G
MEIFDSVLDIAAGVCLVLGALLSLAAGVGLLRFPDVLSRLHAGTKPQILGLVFVVLAIALSARAWPILLVLAPVILFQLLAAPVAAHMVGRAAYRTGNHRDALLTVDELAADVDRASERPPD